MKLYIKIRTSRAEKFISDIEIKWKYFSEMKIFLDSKNKLHTVREKRRAFDDRTIETNLRK